MTTFGLTRTVAFGPRRTSYLVAGDLIHLPSGRMGLIVGFDATHQKEVYVLASETSRRRARVLDLSAETMSSCRVVARRRLV